MFNFLFHKTDSEIQRDVVNELKWDLMVTATKWRVLVRKGIVTLRGYVPMLTERTHIADAARRVAGVRSINNEIEVDVKYRDQRWII